MGVTGANAVLGIGSSRTAPDITALIEGQAVAIEAAGHLFTVLRFALKSAGDLERYAHHLYSTDERMAEAPIPELAHVVTVFVAEMLELKKRFSVFVVVFEGPPYTGKSEVSANRAGTGRKAYEDKQYASCVRVSDCLARLVMAELSRCSIDFLCPPAEADSQLALLQVR